MMLSVLVVHWQLRSKICVYLPALAEWHKQINLHLSTNQESTSPGLGMLFIIVDYSSDNLDWDFISKEKKIKHSLVFWQY